MPTVLSGVVDDNVILAGQRVIDMDTVIHQLEPEDTPFTTMLMKLSKRAARSQKVEWLEDELVPRLSALAVSAASGGTTTAITVTATHGQYFRVRDVLRVASTGENLAVTAVSTDVLGVTRSIGAVGALSAASGVDVVKIGNAAAEGATIGTLLQTKKTGQYNYCQIQRDPWGFTNTALASEMYGGNLDTNERTKKLIEHKRQLENTFFFGQRDLDTTAGAVTGYCGGLDDYITTNITDAASGALTENTWETFLESAFRYGSRNKVVFVSPIIFRGLNSFVKSKLAIDDSGPGIKNYGVRLSSYASGGTYGGVQIALKSDWWDFQKATPQLGGRAYVVDMDNVVMRPLRNTTLLVNRQANDEDSKKAEYLTETALQVSIEKSHAVLRGVTAFS